MRHFFTVLLSVLIFSLVMNMASGKAESETIEKGKKVKFDYILTANEEKIESSEESGPIEYVHGSGTLIKGLERQLEGLKVGDKRTIIVPAEEAFGLVDPKAFKEIPKSSLPQGLEPQVNQRLFVRDNNGRPFPVVISEVKDETVVINFNHPLAGKELQFEVTILEAKS